MMQVFFKLRSEVLNYKYYILFLLKGIFSCKINKYFNLLKNMNISLFRNLRKFEKEKVTNLK